MFWGSILVDLIGLIGSKGLMRQLLGITCLSQWGQILSKRSRRRPVIERVINLRKTNLMTYLATYVVLYFFVIPWETSLLRGMVCCDGSAGHIGVHRDTWRRNRYNWVK